MGPKGRRSLLVAIMLLGFLLSPATAWAQDEPEGEEPAPPPRPTKVTLAVLNFSFQEVIRSKKVKIIRGPDSTELSAEETRKILEGETSILTDKFITALVKSGKFKVVEREQMQKIMDEQMLSESGAVDPSKLIEIGKLLGADYLVMGSISLHDLSEKFNQVPGTDKWRRILKAQVIADVKIVNSTSGRIVAAQNGHGTHETAQMTSQPAALDIPAEFMDIVHRKLVGKLVSDVLDTIYPAKVIAFGGDVVTFNRGEGTGLAKGQTVEIFMTGEEMVDPDTGEVLGAEEIKLCDATIIQIAPKFSKARVSGAVADVPVGSIVRFKEVPKADDQRRPRPRRGGGGLPGDD